MTPINCIDCVHVVPMAAVTLCQAPQLAEFIDPAGPNGDTQLSLCQCARSFHHACGHGARWFVKREGIHYSYYVPRNKFTGEGGFMRYQTKARP